jgi:cytochrome c553
MKKQILYLPFCALLVAGTAQAASIDTGRSLYGTHCASCHGALGTPWPASASLIQSAIQGNRGGMGRLSGLSAANLQDIAAYMANPTGSDPTATTGTTGTTGSTGTTGTTGTTAGTTPATGGTTGAANADLDRLFDWLEAHYPRIFASHAASADLSGYYVRYYPGTHVYLAARNGQLYFYDANRPQLGVQGLGGTATWLSWIDLLAGAGTTARENEHDEHGEDEDD